MSKDMTLKQYVELAKAIKEKYDKTTPIIRQLPSYNNQHPRMTLLPKFY